MSKYKFSHRVSRFKKTELKREIKVYCFQKDIELSLEDDNGLVESILYYRFTGKKKDIGDLKLYLGGITNPYIARLSDDRAYIIYKKYLKTLETYTSETETWIRPISLLKDSVEDIKDSIKHTMITNWNKQDVTDHLYLIYVGLSNFINDDSYNEFVKYNKDPKKYGDYFGDILLIDKVVRENAREYEAEILSFQKSVGFV